MQNINGECVDIDAIARLHDFYDKELDVSGFIEEPGHDDEELIMEIRKTQYDYMVDSIHMLNQSYVNAKRYAKGLEAELNDTKNMVFKLKQGMMELSFLNHVFEGYAKSGTYTNREVKLLPFVSMDIERMSQAGITKDELEEFTLMKYDEWLSTQKEDEDGIQVE